jgi:K+-sensing histidine kinase KdpD
LESRITSNNRPQFLDNAGETGKLILDFDWSTTPVGPIEQWSAGLRTTLGIVLHSSFPMFLFWGKEKICFYNDAYRPSLGMSGKHPAIGKPANQVWPEIWEFTSSLIDQVYHTGRPVWFEDQLVPIYRNGRLEDVYWTFSHSPVYGEKDQIEGILVTCIETTSTVNTRKEIEETVSRRTKELEEANASIRKANSYLQDIINSFKQPLQVLEPVFENGEIVDFRFKLTNQAYASYANSVPESIQHKRVSEIFPGYLTTTSFSNVVKTYLSGQRHTWMIHYDQDGLDLYNEMTSIKMGEAVILHFADYTKLKYLELELLKKITELESSNQNLEAFAHAASHDLKEPVRKIRIFTDRLKTQLADQLTERDLMILDKIAMASKRMGNLIEDLLLYSQFSLVPPEKELVDLNENMQQVIEDLEISIHETNASITFGDLPVVSGYKRQLSQMFQNLIGNSLKYHNPLVPLRIQISSQPSSENGKQYYLIEVRDNGIGFEQHFADHIFKLFTRLHASSTHQGSGIGLSTVKKVIDNHNGFIRAESMPGSGASFRVLLPFD